MREKLNKNPMAQVGIILVLLIAVGFMLMKGMGGGEEEGEGAVATAEAPAAVAETGAPIEGEAVSSTTSAVTTPVPAPPLPKDVVSAYEEGKTVVLLLVRDGGIDDEPTRAAVEGLRSVADTAVFVAPARQIARYAAIALGVDVSRVPALVVLRPKRLSEAGPEASITYGYQTFQHVDQLIRDARYDGPAATYHPE
jgi:hypothetical protein